MYEAPPPPRPPVPIVERAPEREVATSAPAPSAPAPASTPAPVYAGRARSLGPTIFQRDQSEGWRFRRNQRERRRDLRRGGR